MDYEYLGIYNSGALIHIGTGILTFLWFPAEEDVIQLINDS